MIARTSNRQVFGAVAADTALQHSAAGLHRIQYLMLALLPRFQQPPPDSPEYDARIYYKASVTLSGHTKLKKLYCRYRYLTVC